MQVTPSLQFTEETGQLVADLARSERERRETPGRGGGLDWLRCAEPVDWRDDWDAIAAEHGALHNDQQERDAFRAAEKRRAADLSGTINFQPDGRTIRISRTPSTPTAGESGGGARGVITSFSRQSRRRMLALIHSLEKDSPCQFVTLTYHETDPTPPQAKAHLQALYKRMARRFAGVRWSMVWRMEVQKRGQIHFHLLIFGMKWLSWSWTKRAWHSVTGETSESHRAVGAWIKALTTARAVSNYCAKYCAKESSESEIATLERWEGGCGRIWGVRRAAMLPRAEWAEPIAITWGMATAIISQIMRKIAPKMEYIPASVRMFADDTAAYLRALGFTP